MKNLSKNLLIFVLGLLLVGGVAFAYNGSSKVVVEGDYIEAQGAQGAEESFGAFPGGDIYSNLNVHGVLLSGGGVTSASTTLTSALTLTSKQVCENSVITVNTAATASLVAAASLDITMPATSTLFADCLRQEGDEVTFWLINASPTAASTTELVAGTGCEGMISGDTGAADTIAGSAGAEITLKRIKDFWGVNGTTDCIFLTKEIIKD